MIQKLAPEKCEHHADKINKHDMNKNTIGPMVHANVIKDYYAIEI